MSSIFYFSRRYYYISKDFDINEFSKEIKVQPSASQLENRLDEEQIKQLLEKHNREHVKKMINLAMKGYDK